MGGKISLKNSTVLQNSEEKLKKGESEVPELFLCLLAESVEDVNLRNTLS